MVNFSGNPISFDRETLAKDGGSEVNIDDLLKENTNKDLTATIAIFAMQTALNMYMF